MFAAGCDELQRTGRNYSYKRNRLEQIYRLNKVIRYSSNSPADNCAVVASIRFFCVDADYALRVAVQKARKWEYKEMFSVCVVVLYTGHEDQSRGTWARSALELLYGGERGFGMQHIGTRGYYSGDDDICKASEKRFGLVTDDNRPVQKTSTVLMRDFEVPKTVVKQNVWKLVKSVSTHFVGMAMEISRTISKWCLKWSLESTTSASACFGSTRDVQSKVIKAVLTVLIESM